MTMDSDATDMTPTEAAATLATLEGYEERLTAKAFGITLMAFGLASPGISLTYFVAEDYFLGLGQPWWLSFLWIPWIASALILTMTVWNAQALSLGRREEGPGPTWLYGLLFSGIYIVLMVGLILAERFSALDLGDRGSDLFTVGLFTLVLATFFRIRHDAARLTAPLYGGGLLIIAAAIVMAVVGASGIPAELLGTGLTMLAWVGAGAIVVKRG